MYITKEQLEARLKGQVSRDNISIITPHTGNKKKEIPHEAKVLIGAFAQVDTHANVAKAFNVSETAVSTASRGMSGNNKEFSHELAADIKKVATGIKGDISSKALDVLMSSLGVVETKVGAAKATDASTIAKNMAIVHEKMSPRSEGLSNSNHILIQINAPNQRSEDAYEAMEVVTVE
jgi:hypothetical protein